MKVLAGTSKGVYTIEVASSNGAADTQTDAAAGARSVLDSRGVRDVVTIGDRVFAATGAGIHRSDDGGETWALAGLADYEIWQIRPAGSDVIYAGTQPAGLFRSDDGGETWNELTSFTALPQAADWCVPLDPPLPGRARALVVDRDDPNRLWVGIEVGGIARTEDGGQTWAFDQPGGNPDLHMMFAHPGDDGVLFASTGYGRFDHIAEMVEPNAGVFRSDDYGQSWSYAWKGITPRYSRPMCIDDRAPHGLTVASAPTAFSNHTEEGGAGAMLYRSDDNGDSWRSLCDATHSPSAANFHGLMTDPETPGGVIVGTDTGEVWRVTDDAHWTELGSGMPSVLSLAAL